MTDPDRAEHRRVVADAVLRLDGRHRDRDLLGGKGAALDDLLAWGLRVPPTGAVTTAAYRAVAAHHEIADSLRAMRAGATRSDAELDRTFVRATATVAAAHTELGHALDQLAARIGDGRRLAVRSSATVEDLESSSFAGQYRSVLDVDPADHDAVVAAVGSVFASLWHRAPSAYRRAFGIDDRDVAMCAVLMQMVPAEQAGVVFTVDPGGRANAARIEVVEGLGESLVSGERTPVAHVVDRDHPPENLDAALAEALDLAVRAEARAGCPQDVEWAAEGGTVWLVQARPITVTDTDGDGFDDPLTDHDLTTVAAGEMLPGVVPPLQWQLCAHLVEQAFRRVLDDLGVTMVGADRPLLRRVRGRAALDFSVLAELASQLPGGATDQLEAQYFGSRRPGRPTGPATGRGNVVRRLRNDLRVLASRRHAIEGADTVVRTVERLEGGRRELERCSDRDLLAYRSRLIDLGARATADELAIAAVAVSAFRRLELSLARRLGDDRGTAAAEQVTSAAGLTVAIDPRASAAIFSGTTWDEQGRVPPARSIAPDERARRGAAAVDELLDELSVRPGWGEGDPRGFLRRVGLRRLVSDVVAQLGRREATKAAVLSVGGAVRRVHLELGRRLAERDGLGRPEEVDLMSDLELRSALRGSAPPGAVLARRARWLDRCRAEGPLPARFSGEPQRTVVDLPEGQRLEGWATSAGRVTGVARVLRSSTESLEPGEVLVAEATDASWSPLFVQAGGIVLERGGPLSHASILARELGVPAVSNVGAATALLDGRRVTVDGDAGVVVVHGEGDGPRGEVAPGASVG